MAYSKEHKRYLTSAEERVLGITPAGLPVPKDIRTDSDIADHIRTKFQILESLTDDVISGGVRSLLVSGPPGVGKSFTIDQKVGKLPEEKYAIVKGFSRATGIYRKLYENRNAGHVVIFDDCDSVFLDEVSLNLLKAACDTTDVRHINWGSETKMETADGEPMPTRFTFFGSVIFITNIDFDKQIANGSKIAPHLSALLDRSFYLDLEMKGRRDCLIRIQQVDEDSNILMEFGLTDQKRKEVLTFLANNRDKFRELSLRTLRKLGALAQRNTNWKTVAQHTLFKRGG